jgi:hypothetical protein
MEILIALLFLLLFGFLIRHPIRSLSFIAKITFLIVLGLVGFFSLFWWMS